MSIEPNLDASKVTDCADSAPGVAPGTSEPVQGAAIAKAIVYAVVERTTAPGAKDL